MPPRIAAPLLLSILAGCSFSPPPEPLHADGRPAVHAARAVHAVRFPHGLPVLAASEQAGLETFLARTGAGRGDRVTLLVGADADLVENRRRDALATLLAGRGLRVAVVADPEPRAGILRVAVDRTVAVAQGCPDWTESPLQGWRNETRPGFGCASAANLAAMVARPVDIARGDDPGPARLPDAPRGARGTSAAGSAASAGGGASGTGAPSGGSGGAR